MSMDIKHISEFGMRTNENDNSKTLTMSMFANKDELIEAQQAEITRLNAIIADMQKIDDVMMGENERKHKADSKLLDDFQKTSDMVDGEYVDIRQAIQEAIDEAMRGEV